MKFEKKYSLVATLLGLSVALGAATAAAEPANPNVDADRLCEGHGKKGEGAKARKHGKHGKRFARLDKNGDGFITADEVDEKRWERIARADANGDAKISKQELKDAMKQRRQERRGKKGGRARDRTS